MDGSRQESAREIKERRGLDKTKMFYRKKPVVIEAIQWTGENIEEILKFGGRFIEASSDDPCVLLVKTLEGDLKLKQWSFIIKGVSGEFYPCDPDIFNKTYEAYDPDAGIIVTDPRAIQL